MFRTNTRNYGPEKPLYLNKNVLFRKTFLFTGSENVAPSKQIQIALVVKCYLTVFSRIFFKVMVLESYVVRKLKGT